MPVCGCTGACNCFISEDGYLSGHPELGRNFTQVEGNGTEANPYTFHFYDSLEFRPRTVEISVPNRTIPHDTYMEVQGDGANIGAPLYESPSQFVFNDPLIESMVLFTGNYFVFGATATFAQAADTTAKIRKMLIVNTRGMAGTGDNYVAGGQTTPGGSTDPITLSCETMNPGLFDVLTGLETIIGGFQVYLYQNSGAPLNVTDIRIWLTQI
jgi:hypothetical protein